METFGRAFRRGPETCAERRHGHQTAETVGWVRKEIRNTVTKPPKRWAGSKERFGAPSSNRQNGGMVEGEIWNTDTKPLKRWDTVKGEIRSTVTKPQKRCGRETTGRAFRRGRETSAERGEEKARDSEHRHETVEPVGKGDHQSLTLAAWKPCFFSCFADSLSRAARLALERVFAFPLLQMPDVIVGAPSCW